MKDFGIILNNHNLKATPQRLEMLSIINKTGHINIDDLYVKVKDKYDSISLATIYKNINAMITNMQLLEVKIPNNKSVYEIVKEEHSHLVCKKCNNIFDIEIDTSNMINDLSSKYNFKVDRSDLVLSGICDKCIG